MTDLDPEILFEFLIESRENLDGIERELVVLERDPDAMESIRVIFRAIHTVKGTAGFLGLERLQRLTHVGENLLSLLRDEELRFSPALATVLLRLVDAVRGMLDHIEQHHVESDDAQAALLADLAAAAAPGAPSEAPAPAPAIE
ncbi:MAG: Hpt domain-containing protein, partial [Deltaproteobacteria bacterium]|nr:Hpt domain-containing protein [Deltaproteobacteria bacterium]